MLKGYNVSSGYMGWIEELKKYMLFANESDYREYVEDQQVLAFFTTSMVGGDLL